MLRVKKKENNKHTPNVKLKNSCTIINILPNNNNDNNYKGKINLTNKIGQNRSNKFLSIKERQRIIREINESKNEYDLNINLYDRLEKEKLKTMKKDNKNKLYIKKTKSDINLLDMENNNDKNKVNSKIDIKFTDNRIFVNRAIKEYYKKIDTTFKDYLNNLNNKNNDNKMQKSQKIINNNSNISYYSNNNKNKNKINNYHGKENSYNKNKEKNINIEINEIYRKPNLGKFNDKDKTNINEIKDEINNINKIKPNKSFINLDKIFVINSARKEKINCTKMINNNKNNGLTNNIFNKINNYSTTTYINNDNNKNNSKINFKQK